MKHEIKQIKYWVVDVMTESGDEHAYILTGSDRPTREQVDEYLKTKLPQEYDYGGFTNWVLREDTPFPIESIGKTK